MIARSILEARIGEVREALRRARLMRHVAAVFALGILLRGSFLLAALNGRPVPAVVNHGSIVALIILLAIAWLRGRRNIWSDHAIARLIEEKHPTLDSLLLTAIDHEPQAEQPGGYLHERLIDHALARAATQNWPVTVADRPYRRALAAAVAAMVLFTVIGITQILTGMRGASGTAGTSSGSASAESTAFTATLTPGDVEVERGSRLIVEARFDGPIPAEATLVVTEPDGKERERMPMRLTVDEQVFGGMIAKADRNAKYHVEFADQKSAQHTITVFDYPALVRADVTVTPPAYTKLPAKETKNTQKVSALEGSTLAWRVKVNKPLAASEFFGEDKTVVELKPSTSDPTVLEATMQADKTRKYRLHLVDDRERANKNPPWFTVTVQSNQLAKIEVVFPKRDVQVSALQELSVEARVSDDLGVIKSGAVFNIAGSSKEILFQHPKTAPQKKQDVKAQLALETEKARPRQLVSYYFWAEDTGPKGEVRRSMSDMFFADVRHFEDIFREMEAPPSEPGQPKGQTAELVDLQKQVVNATWRIVRDTNGGRSMEAAAPDVDVVHQSQGIAMEQTKEAMEMVEDEEIKTALTEAWKSMKDALDPLQQAAEDKKRTPLNQALTFEQTALEWLHRAQSREHQVMRPKSQQASGAQQANKNQIMDLELKQQEQRYEEEKMAGEEQTAEQQENLQVLNRLKELARRQEALAEKMKELENQLAKAKTEEEKNELQNQLQRLQDEQEQLLRDLDDLKERMDKPENASNMAEAKEQLEQTRDQVVDAAEKLKEEQLADAANAATRAQRELEKMQEDFRQKTSKRFAEEMKQLRAESRQAAERQKQISEALENQKTGDETSDTSASLEKMLNGSQVARQIEEQQGKLKELLENMRRISEEAEGNNPLLHRNLYEAVRNAQTGGLEDNLQEARDQARYGDRSGAQEAERKATASVEQLQKGVEKAAESVLGSETEALRMARSELDKLLEEVRSEEQKGDGSKPGDAEGKQERQAANQAGSKPGDKPEEGEAKGGQVAANQSESKEGQKPGEKEGQTPGEGQQPDGKGRGEPNKEGQAKGLAGSGEQPGEKPGESPGQSESQGQGKGKGKGQSKEQAQAEGEGKGQGQGQGKGQEQAQADGEGKGQGQSKGQGKGEGQQPGQSPSGSGELAGDPSQPGSDQPKGEGSGQSSGNPQTAMNRGSESGGGGGGANRTGDDRRRTLLPNAGGANEGGLFFDQQAEVEDRRPLTGAGYEQWTDRLRNVEELLNQPQLRNEAAKILDNARAMRVDHERNNMAPQTDHLQMRITQPLVELRDRVAEELAKRDVGNPMVPVDRDPVPPAFRDLVRRYYTELGAGK